MKMFEELIKEAVSAYYEAEEAYQAAADNALPYAQKAIQAYKRAESAYKSALLELKTSAAKDAADKADKATKDAACKMDRDVYAALLAAENARRELLFSKKG